MVSAIRIPNTVAYSGLRLRNQLCNQLCSGIICENLNGDHYCAVRLDCDDIMTVGYIKKKEIPLSPLGQMYVEELSKYKDQVLE